MKYISCSDREISLYDIETYPYGLTTRYCLNIIASLEVHPKIIKCLKFFSSDRLITGSSDGTIDIWDVESEIRLIKTISAHDAGIFGIQVIDNGFLTCSADKKIKLWSMVSNICVNTFEEHTKAVWCIRLLNNERYASGSDDCKIKIWSMNSENCLKTLEGHTGGVFCIDFLPNSLLISGSFDKSIRFWNMYSSNCMRILEGHSGSILSLKILSKEKFISSSKDKQIKVWDINTGKCIKTNLDSNVEANSIDQLKNEKLFTAGSDGTVKIWTINLEFLNSLKVHPSSINCLAIYFEHR